MKTTIELPPDLALEIKLLADHEGRKLKDVAADLLKRGLSAGTEETNPPATEDLLLVAPPNAPEMTPERIRQILA